MKKDSGYNQELSVQDGCELVQEPDIKQDRIITLDSNTSNLVIAERFLECFYFFANLTKILCLYLRLRMKHTWTDIE